MGFENRYKRLAKSKSGGITHHVVYNLGDIKILQIFGFTPEQVEGEHHIAVTTTKDEWGFTVSEKRREEYDIYEVYTRTKPSPNPELEDQFAPLYFKKFDTVWDCPDFDMSERDFFINTAEKKGKYRKITRWSGLIAFAVYMMLGKLFARFDSVLLYIVMLVTALLVWFFLRTFASSKARESWDQGKLSEAEIQKNRDAWIDSLYAAFGHELGDLLKQLACQLNFDFTGEK